MAGDRRGCFFRWVQNRQPWEWSIFAELNDYILFGLPVQKWHDGTAAKINVVIP